MFSIKIHRQSGEVLLAACDADILGQTFRDGEIRIKVGEGFYGGETVDEEELMDHMASCSAMNLVGNKTVEIAIRENHVDGSCVMVIGGVKHAQVLR